MKEGHDAMRDKPLIDTTALHNRLRLIRRWALWLLIYLSICIPLGALLWWLMGREF